jgi:O-6-methylguanine DNA methyltransferase
MRGQEMSKKKGRSTRVRSQSERVEYTSPVRLPFGVASMVIRGKRVLAIAWEEDGRRLLCSIRAEFPGAKPAAARNATGRGILDRYAAGEFPDSWDILSLPFAWERVSVFDRKILKATIGVPAGRTATYGEVAGRAGRSGAARAAGGALGRNPWPVVIPCHRVVGAMGDLTGFGKGLHAKRALIAFESALPGRWWLA